MKLDYTTATPAKNTHVCIGKRTAYHQAGHVAAIYLGNKQKNLPAVHFQLAVKPYQQEAGFTGRYARIPSKCAVKLEGGRLLPDLPCSYEMATRRLSPTECQQCQCAFEADVINLLAGSLAEAKYVALRDDEVFNANLVYLGALKFYGGSRDLAIVNEYMDCLFQDNKTERKQKLAELFLAAYGFINDRANWLAITRLAEAIHNNPHDVFTCEELIGLLDSTKLADKSKFAAALVSDALSVTSH
jgi:hypothetical protein